jgi:hypothetical protein
MRAAARHARRRLRALESRGPGVRKRVEITAWQGGQRPAERAKGRETMTRCKSLFRHHDLGFRQPHESCPAQAGIPSHPEPL